MANNSKIIKINGSNPAVKEYLEAFKKGVEKLSEKQKKILFDSIAKDDLENKKLLNSIKNKSLTENKKVEIT
jgi:hypothetical protein